MRRVIGLLFIAGAASAAYSQNARPQVSVAERAEMYQRIAAIESTVELERLARDAAASTDAAEAAQLQLILERHFELDAASAVKLAGELLPWFAGSLYERLARSDVNEALSALSQIDAPAEARIASQAVFRALGSDEQAYDLVAASLQGGTREQFRADALPQLAATAPQRALDEALSLPDADKGRSLAMAIVARWANEAGSEAVAAADRVADPGLRTTLWTTALRNWRDADEVLAYVATLPPERRGEALTNASLDRLVVADAQRVAGLAQTLPDDEQRTQILSLVGSSYARQDPEAAVAWARSLDPPQPDIVANAVQLLASREPLRAFDLAASFDEPQRSRTYGAVVNGVAFNQQIGATQLLALADRVLRIGDEETKTRLVMTLVDTWANRRADPEGALAWMNANEAALPVEAFERVGLIFATSKPNDAAAYVDRVPSRARAAWIGAVTAGYAATDVQGASRFLERFRGEPGFDRGAMLLAQQMAESDPPGAARLLDSIGARGSLGVGAELAIARSWAQRDPAAAAAWALDLPMPQRSIALMTVTGVWGSREPDAVRQWALRMPAGERRDTALAAAIRARGAAPPDPALLAAFSEERARQTAMLNTIMMTAQADPAAAKLLIAEHITDPRMRTQVEEAVDGFARGMVPLPTGGFAAPGGFGGRPPGVGPGAIGGVPIGAPRLPDRGLITSPGPVTGPMPPSPPPTDVGPTTPRQ